MTLLGEAWPVFGWTDDMRSVLADARRHDRTVALATIVALEGSAPRQVGTQMVFDGAQASGHFSSGCIEADIANHAAAVARSGEPALLRYGRNSPWIDIRLVCGAGMEILVERIEPDDPAIARLLDLTAARTCAVYASDGRSRTVASQAGAQSLAFARDPLYLLRPYEPQWRLVVVGGDPTALAIAHLATQAGISTSLIRPDGPIPAPPFECSDYRRGDAIAELEALAPDPWTAIAIAIHEPDIEHGLLLNALRGEAAYVGVLGAAARVPERRERLEQAGVAPSQLARLRAPMGLAGCGKSPWEIAVSVVAEILQTRAAGQLCPAISGEPAQIETLA